MAIETIALIGMPGSGKTSIGREAAKLAGLKFIDTDEWITERWGSIEALFEKGEPRFRDIESAVIAEASRLGGTVISTGGGSVLRPKNMEVLKEKGSIAYIYRPLENILCDIDDKTRPLIKGKRHHLGELYRDRKPLYEKYADFTVPNTGTLDMAVQTLAGWIKGEMK